MNKRWAAIGVSLGIVGGGAAGFIATSGSSSVGAETVATRSVTPRATGGSDTTVAGSSGDAPVRPGRGARLAEVLAPLVADGTITQAQADAVIAALEAAGPMGRHGGGMGGPGPGPGGRGGAFGAQLDTIVSTLGLTADEVMTALRDGTTIAELAAQRGVDVQNVIDAAVAAVKTHLDAEVAAGDHTQAEADQMLAMATDAITKFVNGEFTFPMGGGMGGRGGHHGGPWGPGDDDQDGADSTTTTLG